MHLPSSKRRSILTYWSISVCWTVISRFAIAQVECRLWLAPSNLSTEKAPRLGLFAGEPGFAEGEVIPSWEMAVPVFDFLQSPAANRNPENRKIVNFVDSNMWVSDYAGSKFESNRSQSVFIPGIGVHPNHHTGYANVDWLQDSILNRKPDEFLMEIWGKAHPSRGVITPYYNATLMATKKITPGMELLAYLGDPKELEEENIYQEKFTLVDYEKANAVLEKIMEYFDEFGEQMSDRLKDEMLDFILETILDGADGAHAKVIRSLIPAHPDKLRRVKDAGGTFEYRYRDMVKSSQWLEQRGLCVDHLHPGKSTIPDAGRGAFAKRPLEAESIISPVPMMPILNSEVLELYSRVLEITTNGHVEYVLDETKPPTGYQMLMNYCFGHPESSVLFLPTAPIVNLINHAPTGDQVNAKLQWSTHEYVYNDYDFQDVPPSKWDLQNLPPIVMELVATKDINEGDEILIDYGRDWEQSWREYKQAWEAIYPEVRSSAGETLNQKWPLKSVEIRSLYAEKPFPVDIRQHQVPYGPGIVSACYVGSVEDVPDGHPRFNEAGQGIAIWKAPTDSKEFMGQILGICDLMSREEAFSGDNKTLQTWNYTIITQLKDNDVDKLVEVRKVPHRAITLIDRPYTSDVHFPGAFRRWINIEDKLFPQAWRNLRQ